MARPISRNNLLAGLFVIAALVLAIFVAVLVSGVQKLLIPTNTYTIRMSLADGAAGLKKGSVVTVGGQEVGRVTAIAYERATPDAMPTGVLVTAAIYRSITLDSNSAAFLERPLLGSMGSINIIKGPKSTGPASALQPGAMLNGTIAPPAFLAQAGFGPEQADQVRNMFTRANDVVTRIDTLTKQFESDVEPTVRAVRQASEDAAAFTKQFRERAPDWAKSIDTFLAQANLAADDTRAAVAAIRRTVDDNRPAIDAAMKNVEAIAADVRSQSVPALNDLLAAGKNRFEELRSPLTDIANLLKEQEPNIRRTLTNFRLASDQAKLTLIEIRRSPWRLLYQPGNKELDSELFYGAATAYAEAVSDLRATAEALESVAAIAPNATSPLPASERQSLLDLKSRLNDAFNRYDAAERALLQKMTGTKP